MVIAIIKIHAILIVCRLYIAWEDVNHWRAAVFYHLLFFL